jgi:hypothetical protein
MSETQRKNKGDHDKSHKEQRTNQKKSTSDANPPKVEGQQNFDERREEPTREDFKKTS